MTDSEKPSAPPRPLTRKLRFRALAAKPVSMLLLTCTIIIIGCAYTARPPLAEWARIRRLKNTALSATAKVTNISRRLPTQERGGPREFVTLEFRPTPNAKPIVGERLRSLFMHLDEPVQLADQFEILYDPDEPSEFFCPESDDRSFLSHLLVQIIFLAIAGLLLLLAALRYRALINIVCNAPAQLGALAEVRTCAQGAFSRLVVVTFEFEGRNLVIKTIVPATLIHSVSIGESIWLFVPPRKPNRALVAGAFL